MKEIPTIITNSHTSSFSLKRLISKLVLIALGALYISVQAFSGAHAVGSAQLSLNPASGSYQKDSTLKVRINSTSTDPVNAVQADLIYDQANLEFISVDTSATSFTFYCSNTGGDGSVKISCANTSPLTGTKVVADVNFKVLAGSGTTAITFASSSAIVRPSDGQNVWNGNSSGGTYTLTTSATPTPTPTPTPTTTTTTTTTTPPSSTKPTPTTPGNQSSPGTTTDESTLPAEETVEKPGYLVAIKIIDNKGNPVAGKTVYMGEQSAVSDDNGIASFVNVKPGSYEITEEKDGKGRVFASVTVNDTPTDPYAVQQFEVNVAPKNKILVYVIPIIGIASLIALLVASMAWYRKFRAKKLAHKNHFPDQPNKTSAKTQPPVETISQSVQPNQQAQKAQSGQTVSPNTADEVTSKKPIVWSGDSNK